MGSFHSKPEQLSNGVPSQNGYSISYWLAGVRSSPLIGHRSSRELPQEADYVIIGSGMMGTMLAYYLMTDCGLPKGSKVVMLESRDFCSGANGMLAGRNGGHMRPDSYDAFPAYQRAFGESSAMALLDSELESFAIVDQLVKTQAIDCDFAKHDCANIHMSARSMHEARAGIAAYTDAKGKMPLRLVDDADEARRLTRVKDAHGAVFYPAASFWPYKFCAHLMHKCLDLGLQLHCNTHVLSTRADGEKGHIVRTSRGDIRTRKVIHCTNGYAATALPQLGRHLKPYKGTCSAVTPTRAFSGPKVLQTSQIIFWDEEQVKRRGVLTNDEYIIHRPADGTIIMGGGQKDPSCFGNSDDAIVHDSSAKYLRALPQELWQDWGSENIGEGVQRVWSGIMSKTPDHLPLVGQYAPNAYLSVGMNGHGMARIPAIAKRIAKLVMADPDTPFAITGLPDVLRYSDKRAVW